MGTYISVDKYGQDVSVHVCLSASCFEYEERENGIYAYVKDTLKDGLKVEKYIMVKRREKAAEFVHNVLNGNVPTIRDEPKADEGELLEVFKFVVERVKRGMHYAGMKVEYTSPRGIMVYFRLKQSTEGDRYHINVDLIAQKEGERLTYQVYGYTVDKFALQRLGINAIETYVAFSDFVTQQTNQHTTQATA